MILGVIPFGCKERSLSVLEGKGGRGLHKKEETETPLVALCLFFVPIERGVFLFRFRALGAMGNHPFDFVPLLVFSPRVTLCGGR